ncbi:MAG: hypothetical protein NZT61_02320 [Deltaproteobacteria bacterium]|nr:hypothetical protein [Deltaproteobacteria bacterium]
MADVIFVVASVIFWLIILMLFLDIKRRTAEVEKMLKSGGRENE